MLKTKDQEGQIRTSCQDRADVYLKKGCLETNEETKFSDFNALQWWKTNHLKFKVLSWMAA